MDRLNTSALGGPVARDGFDDTPSAVQYAPARTAPTAAAAPGMRRLVSCVMPAYNERDVIAHVVRRVLRALERLTEGFELIVVDDGSTDGTGRILDDLMDENLRVVHFATNAGYGKALRTGFEIAAHPLVFFLDSDDQFDPADLDRLLRVAAGADIVVGYRAQRRDSAMRSVLSGGYNTIVRGLLDVNVRDINCAFKLMRRDALGRLPLTSDGYAINAEILARAARAGLRIREVPVSHQERRSGRSKVGFGDIPRSLAQVVTLRRSLRNGHARRDPQTLFGK